MPEDQEYENVLRKIETGRARVIRRYVSRLTKRIEEDGIVIERLRAQIPPVSEIEQAREAEREACVAKLREWAAERQASRAFKITSGQAAGLRWAADRLEKETSHVG